KTVYYSKFIFPTDGRKYKVGHLICQCLKMFLLNSMVNSRLEVNVKYFMNISTMRSLMLLSSAMTIDQSDCLP
ncbi:MAG: hypothetical protein AAB013_05170, partial [Planctomycetota bacterium]